MSFLLGRNKQKEKKGSLLPNLSGLTSNKKAPLESQTLRLVVGNPNIKVVKINGFWPKFKSVRAVTRRELLENGIMWDYPLRAGIDLEKAAETFNSKNVVPFRLGESMYWAIIVNIGPELFGTLIPQEWCRFIMERMKSKPRKDTPPPETAGRLKEMPKNSDLSEMNRVAKNKAGAAYMLPAEIESLKKY